MSLRLRPAEKCDGCGRLTPHGSSRSAGGLRWCPACRAWDPDDFQARLQATKKAKLNTGAGPGLGAAIGGGSAPAVGDEEGGSHSQRGLEGVPSDPEGGAGGGGGGEGGEADEGGALAAAPGRTGKTMMRCRRSRNQTGVTTQTAAMTAATPMLLPLTSERHHGVQCGRSPLKGASARVMLNPEAHGGCPACARSAQLMLVGSWATTVLSADWSTGRAADSACAASPPRVTVGSPLPVAAQRVECGMMVSAAKTTVR